MFLSRWDIINSPLSPRNGFADSTAPAQQSGGPPAAAASEGPPSFEGPPTANFQGFFLSFCCPADADGDLQPPRYPKSLTKKPHGRNKPQSSSPEGPPQGPPQGFPRGTLRYADAPADPLEGFWVFEKRAEALNEVGRSLWSAAVMMGRFLLRAPEGPHGPLSALGAPDRPPTRVFRILELGSGVGFMGPLLRRALQQRPAELWAPTEPCTGGPILGASTGAHRGPPVEIYLTDIDSEALRLCSKTQRLDEVLLGAPLKGPFNSRLSRGPPKEKAAAATAAQEGPARPQHVIVRTRRLDWRQGGPWAAEVQGKGCAASVEASVTAGASYSTPANEEPFAWTREETETLGKEGALSLILASDGKGRAFAFTFFRVQG